MIKSVTDAANLRDLIVSSKQYAAFQRVYTKAINSVDCKSAVAEILKLHGTRTIRSVGPEDMIANAQTRLVGANLQNQAYRSRATTLRAHMFLAYSDLEDVNDRFYKWAAQQFQGQLTDAGYKSQTSQLNYINNLIGYSLRHMKTLKASIAVADSIIADLDACGYSLGRIDKAIALESPERYHK